FMPESRSPERMRLDPAGMAIVSAAMLLLVYPLVEGRDQDWPAWMFGLMAAAAVLLAVFAVYERRIERAGRSPLVMLSLFRKRAFSGGLAVGIGFFAGMTGVMFALTLFFQLGLGFSPTDAAVAMVPLS